MSLSTRLAGMFAGAAVVIFALIGTMLYCILDRQTERLQQGEVDVRFNMVSRMLDHPDLAERWPHLQGKLDNLSQEYELIRFWIDSDDPRYHYGRFSEPVQRLIADGAGRYELQLPEHRYALTARVGVLPAREGRPRLTYVTAIDSAAFHEARTSTVKWLLGLSALGVLLASLLGHWIARLGLWPVHRLSEEARRISPRQLSQRLQLSPLPAELRELVGAFNGALDRLEQAYVRLESFNADVAHELRTPLTNLIGQTQVALSRERSGEHYEEVLQSNLEELERLRAIVNDMLFLARADQGRLACEREETSLAGEIATTVDFLEVIFDEAGVGIEVRGEARALVERALFQRAVTNLLYNAAQHTAAGGHAAGRRRAAWRRSAGGGEQPRRADRRRAPQAPVRALLSGRRGAQQQRGQPWPRPVHRQGGGEHARRFGVRRQRGRLEHLRLHRAEPRATRVRRPLAAGRGRSGTVLSGPSGVVRRAGLLAEDIDADQYRAGQHEALGPGASDQVAGKGDAGPHQADGVDLALERDAFAVEIVADPRAEPWMADQPVVEARRAAHEAGRREEQERRGRQHRQEDADHAQGYA